MKKLELPAFQKELIDSWEAKLSALFDGEIPADAEWYGANEIAGVFDAMLGNEGHILLPTGGDEDLRSVRASKDGLLEWSGDDDSLDKYARVVKPVRLVFSNPGNQTHEAHFILEVDAMPAALHDGYANADGIEECVELAKGSYAPRSAWDNNEFQGKPLPESARLVIRATKPGRYALFGRGAIYCKIRDSTFDAYSAFHNDAAQFEMMVAKMAAIEIA